MLRSLMIVLAFAGLAGCATQQEMVWVRTDGQSGKANPVLTQQFRVDQTICQGDLQKANMSATPIYSPGLIGAIGDDITRGQQDRDVARGCMAQRGYVQVPKSGRISGCGISRRQASVIRKRPPSRAAPPIPIRE